MKAAIYTAKGNAAEVLQVTDLPTPSPAAGEVLVRVSHSGVNPSDVKGRSGVGSSAMEHGLVIPHSDGAGRVQAVGEGVSHGLIGQQVWLHNAQWLRAHGTASEYIALPASLAAPLPDGVPTEVGASIGIPLMTAVHAIDALGPLLNKTVLVFGATGAVGAYATQLAARSGARVIAVVSSEEKAARALSLGAEWTLNYKSDDLAAGVREITRGRGVDAIIEVDAATNARHWGELLRFGGQVVVYGSSGANIGVAFRPLIANFARLYFFIVYLLPDGVRKETLRSIEALLTRCDLLHPPTTVFALNDIARAHEMVEAGAPTKVLIAL
ncbi:NADPH:quinone reductase [Roseateles sp. P5_E11]